ncbi:Uncharacterised protein [Klebsiella pneumoniae]|uniref:Uncharacterized protein n=1 Tax=Klebsiella pneumoniae TaxID=573 RepID=A0A378BPJ2_KLEPN|nr:Uncharacterised protein [Klebsiella pneumoniae]
MMMPDASQRWARRLYTPYSSESGVAPRLLTSAITRSPFCSAVLLCCTSCHAPLTVIPLAQRAAVSAVFQQGIEHLIDGLVQRAEAAAVDARLAVNADAELHLVIFQRKGGLPGSRYGAGAEGDTNRVAEIVQAAAQFSAGFQRVAALGGAPTSFSISTVLATPRRPAV